MSINVPKYCTPGSLHPDRLALSTPIERSLAIEGALVQALWHVRKHALPQAAGHCIKAARLLKLACQDARQGEVA